MTARWQLKMKLAEEPDQLNFRQPPIMFSTLG